VRKELAICRRTEAGQESCLRSNAGGDGEQGQISQGIPFMPAELFQASRWTRGNLIFPTIIEVSDKAVTRRKRSWFSRDEISMSVSKIASVHVKTGLVWSDILIESSGGTDPLTSHGHQKGDAVRIKELIENHQAELARKSPVEE
jgi:hypothetical protein